MPTSMWSLSWRQQKFSIETMPETAAVYLPQCQRRRRAGDFHRGLYCTQSCNIDSGMVDMIDLELFTGDDQVKETVAYAHAHDVKVVMSNHDFHKRRKPKKSLPVCAKCNPSTPIFPKIALMPQSTSDVLTLLAATTDAGSSMPIVQLSRCRWQKLA